MTSPETTSSQVLGRHRKGAPVTEPGRSRQPGTGWEEKYYGGDAAEENRRVRGLAADIMAVQAALKKKAGARQVLRGFHAKSHAGVTNAEFRVAGDLPADLQVGYLRPGAVYPATVRLSNASGTVQPDSAKDFRGLAVRVHVGPDEVHDLLMTNGPVSHAGDPIQFITFARAMAGSKLLAPFRLLFGLGPFVTLRMFRTISKVVNRTVRSLASETYWSRGAFRCGALAVRFLAVPAAGTDPGPDAPDKADPNYLHGELAARLSKGPVTFDLKMQRFVDEARTPIEDGAVEWKESDAPPVTVARVVIPQQEIDSAPALATAAVVDGLEFNPWHTTDEFRPLGFLQRARQMVYTASSDHRYGFRFYRPASTRNALFGGLSRRFFLTLNQFVPWHKLPSWMGSLNLLALRQVMRRKNIYDVAPAPDLPVVQPRPRSLPPVSANPTEFRPAALGPSPYLPADSPPVTGPVDPEVLTVRKTDVAFNDLADPHMGSAGAIFGRNVPLDRAVPNPKTFLDPNPRLVSQRLLTRDSFKPARTLNLLAAAWIQFQTHDWFDHKRHQPGENDLIVPLEPGDPWGEHPMRIPGSVQAHPGSAQPPRPPAFINTETAWWDASQIYGSREADTRTFRSGVDGKMKINDDGLLPLDPDPSRYGIDNVGFNNNWWVGLSLLHTLFIREHNAICDALKREYPGWDDDRLFHKARMINAALIGKIHTVEWTPAILANPVLEQSMNIVWSGAPNDWLTRLGIWLVEAETLRGVPGSLPVHHAAPYTNTEEFVTVYKMHPLMPDDFSFHSHVDDRPLARKTLTEIQGNFTRGVLQSIPMNDLYYSFGVSNPGAITLHNYPRALQRLEKTDGTVLDLATVDIVRERERGVPRYNDFRELLHMPRVKSFEKMTDNPEWAKELREVYGHVDKVDTMVGMFSETPPAGFGFSDTTFHIFILTATRRIQSDRFLTVDFTDEVYTPLGIRWVQTNGMKSVLLRHFPELRGFLMRVENAFKPWHRAPSAATAPGAAAAR